MAEEKAQKKTKVPTARKRFLQSEKRRLINKAFKSQMRTAVRGLEESLAKKESAAISTELNAVYSLMDRGVKRGIIKQNKASRSKSRFAVRAQKARA